MHQQRIDDSRPHRWPECQRSSARAPIVSVARACRDSDTGLTTQWRSVLTCDWTRTSIGSRMRTGEELARGPWSATNSRQLPSAPARRNATVRLSSRAASTESTMIRFRVIFTALISFPAGLPRASAHSRLPHVGATWVLLPFRRIPPTSFDTSNVGVSNGPNGGTVTCLNMDPRNPMILFAGTHSASTRPWTVAPRGRRSTTGWKTRSSRAHDRSR